MITDRARVCEPAIVLPQLVALLAATALAAAPAPAAVPCATGLVCPDHLYVDPEGAAPDQVREHRAQGREAEAAALERIAGQPQPLWVGGSADDVADAVVPYLERARAAGARPLLVGYSIPGRDCGAGYSGGGVSDGAAYRAWASAFAEALRGSGAIVVLEPDAIPHALQGSCDRDADERFALLADATAKLADAGAAVYIDAGHPSFTGDVEATADALRSSGVDRAAGFSLNVSYFASTEANVEYGTAISALLGGTHFVIDTSRNGAPDEPDGWCNPPGRRIGEPPTLDPGIPLVDALLWIKRPGESDGDCGGAPPAGQWYEEYALGLVGL
ncbi:endoglucanase [Pseudonocardia thermophila]|uniref:Glucanase n=1 Tax=Pseudonocardia thermophila TaxID=1848 RepID=A0A1M6PAG8_PSETH|nr:glycoside hydrolase family 6 protein [Pseudonocardia thermophila]SHK04945.1 endoglucanase [Pseudonocardia thermophila]